MELVQRSKLQAAAPLVPVSWTISWSRGHVTVCPAVGRGGGGIIAQQCAARWERCPRLRRSRSWAGPVGGSRLYLRNTSCVVIVPWLYVAPAAGCGCLMGSTGRQGSRGVTIGHGGVSWGHQTPTKIRRRRAAPPFSVGGFRVSFCSPDPSLHCWRWPMWGRALRVLPPVRRSTHSLLLLPRCLTVRCRPRCRLRPTRGAQIGQEEQQASL